jgi:putative ABC transport system permease protein
VIGNVKFTDLTTEFMPESYIPSAQLPFGSMTLVARSTQDPHSVAQMITGTVQSMDSDMPTYSSKTVEEYLDGTLSVPRFNTALLAIFSGLAMLLTAVGLYGVISYSVAQRTHEIGIRMALGAKPKDMLRLIVGQGLRLGLIGVGIGFAIALGLTHFLSSLLFGVTATDPLSFASVIFLLLVVVLLACYVPARRAMRVDPVIALRHE